MTGTNDPHDEVEHTRGLAAILHALGHTLERISSLPRRNGWVATLFAVAVVVGAFELIPPPTLGLVKWFWTTVEGWRRDHVDPRPQETHPEPHPPQLPDCRLIPADHVDYGSIDRCIERNSCADAADALCRSGGFGQTGTSLRDCVDAARARLAPEPARYVFNALHQKKCGLEAWTWAALLPAEEVEAARGHLFIRICSKDGGFSTRLKNAGFVPPTDRQCR